MFCYWGSYPQSHLFICTKHSTPKSSTMHRNKCMLPHKWRLLDVHQHAAHRCTRLHAGEITQDNPNVVTGNPTTASSVRKTKQIKDKTGQSLGLPFWYPLRPAFLPSFMTFPLPFHETRGLGEEVCFPLSLLPTSIALFPMTKPCAMLSCCLSPNIYPPKDPCPLLPCPCSLLPISRVSPGLYSPIIPANSTCLPAPPSNHFVKPISILSPNIFHLPH